MKVDPASRCSRGPLLVLLGATLVLTGCGTVGPDYQRPTADLAPEWQNIEEPGLTADTGEYSAWWGVFEDPTLESLVQAAYEQNLTVRGAAVRILEARAQLGVARGNLYPQQQQISGGIFYNTINPSGNSTVGDLNFTRSDLSFDVAWELDVWGKLRGGVDAADAAYLASIASYDDFLVSLVADVAAAYTLIRTYEQRIAIARENVGIQQRSIQIADVRFRNGATTELDVQQAKSLLASTQSTIPRLKVGQRQAQNALDILLGVAPGQDHTALTNAAPIPSASVTVAVGAPADLLRRRPDVRQAELLAASQAALVGVSKSDMYPAFALSGSLGLRDTQGNATTTTGEEGLGDLFNGDSTFALGGGGFTWPIFNYGRLRNQVRVQDARYEQLLIAYENTVLRAAREAEDAMTAFVRSREETVFLKEAEAAARRAVDLALIQYREGANDYTTVLTTQQALVSAQDRSTSVQGDVAQSLIALYKALGGGWQIREGQALLPESTEEEMRERTHWGSLTQPDLDTDGAKQVAPDGE